MNRFGLLMCVGMATAFVQGCKHRDDEVAGVWKNTFGTTYTFNENKTFVRANKAGNATGTWKAEGDKIIAHVDKVNNESYKSKTEKSFKDARSLLPPDFVTIHSNAEFMLSADGHTMTHKNPSSGKAIPYTKQ